jgi:hypothetical protein
VVNRDQQNQQEEEALRDPADPDLSTKKAVLKQSIHQPESSFTSGYTHHTTRIWRHYGEIIKNL